METFDSVIPARSKITDKEMILGIVQNEWEESQRVGLNRILSICAGMGINTQWANEVINHHISCAWISMDKTHINQIRGGIAHREEVLQWREGEAFSLPSICKQCSSSPLRSDIRCPVLYGNPLEIQKINDRVIVNEKSYKKLFINIGDGPLLSSFKLLNENPDAAVVVIDPKVVDGIKIFDYALENNGWLPLYEHNRNHRFVGRKELSREAMRKLCDSYRQNVLESRKRIGSLYLVNSRMQSQGVQIPSGCVDKIFFSYPTPHVRESNPIYLIPFIQDMLAPGGKFYLRTEDANYQTLMLVWEDTQGNGVSKDVQSEEIPYSYYDYYIRQFSKYRVKDYCITKS